MFVENVTEWKFGPEHVFKFNKTTAIYMDHVNESIIEDVTATVLCRPTSSYQSLQDLLYCNVREIVISRITKQIYEDMWKNISTINNIKSSIPKVSSKIPDKFILVKFNTEGLDSHRVQEARRKRMPRRDDITPYYTSQITSDILEQLHSGIINFILSNNEAVRDIKTYEDMTSGSYVIGNFSQSGDATYKASDCTTLWTITYTPSKKYNVSQNSDTQQKERKFDFYLQLIPIPYTNPVGKDFSIHRFRSACNPQRWFVFQNEWWKFENMVITIHLSL